MCTLSGLRSKRRTHHWITPLYPNKVTHTRVTSLSPNTMLLLPSSSSSYSTLHSASWFYYPSSRVTRTAPYYAGNQTLRNRNNNIRCAKRTGKQRYPSEKKKLKSKHKELLSPSNEKSKFEGTWRLYKLAVPLDHDPGKDSLEVSDGLLQEIAKVIKFPVIN